MCPDRTYRSSPAEVAVPASAPLSAVPALQAEVQTSPDSLPQHQDLVLCEHLPSHKEDPPSAMPEPVKHTSARHTPALQDCEPPLAASPQLDSPMQPPDTSPRAQPQTLADAEDRPPTEAMPDSDPADVQDSIMATPAAAGTSQWMDNPMFDSDRKVPCIKACIRFLAFKHALKVHGCCPGRSVLQRLTLHLSSGLAALISQRVIILI